jgi:pimeloyl-ACP methyl ester carboxylesterase
MRTIILLHGALGAHDQLVPLKEELSALHYEVHLLSFSGHGKISFQKDFTIHQFASELELFIRNNHLQKPNIFGYSMGGYVALYLASQNKDLLGDIVTLGTKLKWTKEIADKEIKQLDPAVIKEKVPKFADALQKRHGADWELLLKRTAYMMVALGDNNIIESNFSKITNKVLLGLADNDSMVSVEETDSAARQIPNSDRFTLAGAKHPIETADPKVLADIILQFSG